MTKGYIYHIENPAYPGDLTQGYIGVTNETKGIQGRFMEHRRDARYMRSIIRKHSIEFALHVKEIFYGTMEECYKKEHKLRPHQSMGWNVAAGGAGCNYQSSIKDLKKFRSNLQHKRMKNQALREQQAESFKKHYYSDPQAQQLRKDAALKHMADPEKRSKCLGALHKKKKCPHCDYESNGGNIAKHIKRKHTNV